MESRTQKCMHSLENYDNRDRLSELPDEIIVHILSCMPTVDAVRTMLLRRFGNLWTLVHTLELHLPDFFKQFYLHRQRKEDEDERMLVFVRNVLKLHKRPSINKFHISVVRYYSDGSVKASGEVKRWVRFASGRQAKELELCDMSDYDLLTSNLSVRYFTSQSLVTLLLDSCNIKTRVQVNLPSLKKLSIENCVIHNDILLRFMRGCPSLQELEIEDPDCMDKLSLSAPNIDKLSLVCSYSCDYLNPLPFDCPNLKTLNLDICDGLRITDISSVRDINIQNVSYFNCNDDEHAMLEDFYGKLDGAEVLQLSDIVSHAFLDIVQHLHLLQHKWKRVVLELQKFNQVCLAGIHHLMRSLRNLEDLTIYTTVRFEASTDLLPSEVSSPYVTPQLKTITLHGYRTSWKSQLPLVEFLLKGAAVLEKLVIVPTKDRHYPSWSAKDELEFVKSVSSFPRASPSAKVLFA